MLARFPPRHRQSWMVRRLCTISKILQAGPQNAPVTIQGWVLHQREHKLHDFYVIGDGLSPDTVQVIIDKSKVLQDMKPGTAVSLTGNLIISHGRGQKYDFIPDSIDIIGKMDQNYPLGGKEKCEEGHVRLNLHFRPRMLSFAALLRLRNAAKRIIHDYLQDRNFLCIDTPILTLNDCEGGGEAFLVEPADQAKFGAVVQEVKPDGSTKEIRQHFFGRPAYTTVSGQLHLEAAACALRQVYTLNPAFRAESSLSRQHLAEFYMLEVEMSFVNQLEPLLNLVEDLFRNCSSALLSQNAKDYAFCAKYHNAAHMAIVSKTLASTKPFPRLPYKEAVEILEKGAAENLFPKPVKSGFSKEQERYLVKHCGNLPVFILDFPAETKPFYMARSQDQDYAACFDFLAPLTGEIVGGSLRESDHEVLKNRLAQIGMEEKLAWYIDLRRYGYPKTGGFGLGLERYLQWLIGVRNIKDCLPFPRWYQHCYL